MQQHTVRQTQRHIQTTEIHTTEIPKTETQTTEIHTTEIHTRHKNNERHPGLFLVAR